MIRIIQLIFMIIMIFLSSTKEPQIIYFDDDESIDYKQYSQNIDDLIDESDLIILARNILSLQERIENENFDDQTNLGTRTKVEVINIFKSTESVIDRETLVVLEPFKISKSSNEIELHCYSGYRNMEFEGQYILFLNEHVIENTETIYTINGLYQGKYPLNLINNQIHDEVDISMLEISKMKESTYQLLVNELRKAFQERKWLIETK